MFNRKKITIPAAGETVEVNIRGYAIQVESCQQYESPEQTPFITFDSKGNGLNPIEPRAVFSTQNGFEKFYVEGTAQSAGDLVYLLISDLCMEQQLGQQSTSVKTVIGQTFSRDADDNPKTYSEIADLQNEDGELPTSLYISAAGGDINFTFDVAPDQNSFYHRLPEDESPIEIKGHDAMLKFTFIDALSGTGAKLITTPEYTENV